jgi:hypothetical protein
MSDVRISLAVMHASFDGQRRAMLLDLERALGGRVGLDTHTSGWNYVKDGSRDGVWPTARRAWIDHRRFESTHHLVIQDDITICKDFLASVNAALSVKSDVPVSFFDLSRGITDAEAKGLHWATRKSISMAQAIAIPTPMIDPAIAWIDKHVKPETEGDDERLSIYFLSHGITVWYTVPSLVEHTDNGQSLLGHPDKLPTGKRRIAASFIGTNRSGLDIDWTIGSDKPHRGWSHSLSEYKDKLVE